MTELIDPAAAADPADGLRFNDAGLVCAVVQQYDTGEVLMVAWMNAEALRRTLETGAATYFSRSRREHWVKGETSGNTQRVIEVRRDCDGDTLLVLVDQQGVACHTGTRTCFDDGLIRTVAVPDRSTGADANQQGGAMVRAASGGTLV